MEITFGYQKNLVICSNSDLLGNTWSASQNKYVPEVENEKQSRRPSRRYPGEYPRKALPWNWRTSVRFDSR